MSYLPALALFFLSAAVAPGKPVSIDGMYALGDTRHHVFRSRSLGKEYQLLVGLPPGYDATEDIDYPVVYVLDGGALYPLLVSYSRYLRFNEEVPELIIVGISYGTSDWKEGNDRNRDFTAPTEEREYWGGAQAFQVFLESELLPFIESTYRARAERRMIFGHSLGGQFVLYTAQSSPGLFWGHVASNPALHRNLEFFLQSHGDVKSRGDASKLFVGSGSLDDPRFREPAVAWIEHWSQQTATPWQLKTMSLDGHTHMSTPPAAFRQGMAWLFAGD